MIWRPLGAILLRDLKRMLRQRGRLLSAMIRPLIWLLIIGGGFGSVFRQLGHGDYQQFLVPGVLCMSLLFGSLLASLSLVYDKESGVMRMLMVAPFAHYWILLARTLSSTIVGMVHALLLLAVLFLIGYLPLPLHAPLLLLGLLAAALLSASFGTLIAVFSKNLENFAVIMNFFIFPVFFLSGALYPIESLPPLLKWTALINPFSYGVDLIKHALLPAGPATAFAADFSISRSLLLLTAWTAAALGIACLRFSQPRLIEAFAARLSAPGKR